MQPTVLDVADYFLSRYEKEDSEVTHLQLQKMCYYAQAYHLARYEERMFDSNFEAWAHGPVSPELYFKYRSAGYQPLPFPSNVNINKFTEIMMATLAMVWNMFWDKDPKWLEKQTHLELPWNQARGSTLYGEKCNNTIDVDVMRDYYKGLIGMKEKKPLKPLFKLEQIRQAAKTIDLSARGSNEQYYETIQSELDEFKVLRERAAGAWSGEKE